VCLETRLGGVVRGELNGEKKWETNALVSCDAVVAVGKEGRVSVSFALQSLWIDQSSSGWAVFTSRSNDFVLLSIWP
jgi:hypothetical protein